MDENGPSGRIIFGGRRRGSEIPATPEAGAAGATQKVRKHGGVKGSTTPFRNGAMGVEGR